MRIDCSIIPTYALSTEQSVKKYGKHRNALMLHASLPVLHTVVRQISMVYISMSFRDNKDSVFYILKRNFPSSTCLHFGTSSKILKQHSQIASEISERSEFSSWVLLMLKCIPFVRRGRSRLGTTQCELVSTSLVK